MSEPRAPRETGKGRGSRDGRDRPTTHLFAGPDSLPDVLVLVLHRGEHLFHGGQLFLLGLFRQTVGSAPSHPPLERLDRLFRPLDILQPELGLDDPHIPGRVDIPFDVDDLGIVKRTDHLEDPIDCSDVGQESVAQPSSGRSSRGETGDIDTGQVGGDPRGRFVGLAQPIVSRVRHEDTSLFGVDGGIRKVGSVGQRGLKSACDVAFSQCRLFGGCPLIVQGPDWGETHLGQQVEETRLSDVGYTDDTDLDDSESRIGMSVSKGDPGHNVYVWGGPRTDLQVVTRSSEEDLFLDLALL